MTDTGMNVTQADREAASDWYGEHTGLGSAELLEVAFARHREAAITAAMAQDKAEHSEAVTNYRAALADCERLRMAAEAEIERLTLERDGARKAMGLFLDAPGMPSGVLQWVQVQMSRDACNVAAASLKAKDAIDD